MQEFVAYNANTKDLLSNLAEQENLLSAMQQCAHDDFVVLSREIKPIFDKAKTYFESKGKKGDVQKMFLTNMWQIILDLQFHDIIRQKMEHIQLAVKNMKAELKLQELELLLAKDEVMTLHNKQVDYN